MVHYTSEMLKQETWWEDSRQSDDPLYADGVSYQAYYSEVGKAHYMGKDLTEVRSPQRKLVPDIVGLGQYEPTSLRGIAIKERIDDAAFLNLIRKWLKAGILETDGKVIHPETGTPQGGVISPILANVYLHHVLDLWFEKVVKAHCKGEALIIRYADDFVCAFQYREEAEKFFRDLAKRLNKFGLAVASEKTSLMRFSRFHPSRSRRIEFVGFEMYWTHDQKGAVRVMQRTARKRLQGACRRIKDWIKQNRHLKGIKFIKALNRRLRGHYNYYSVVGNLRSLWRFYNWAIECAFKWLNRRGGKRKSFPWKVFLKFIDRLGVAKPKLPVRTKRHRVFS